jgi:hypothetical protein
VTRPPEFDDLMEGIESPEERERLRRVHDLLVASGPPPELSAALASPQTPPAEEDAADEWLPRRRVWAGLLAGAGALLAAFGVGYLAGNGSSETPTAAPEAPPTQVISLRPADQNNTAGASIRLGRRGTDGNWPMVVTVRGLDHLTRGDYYTLVLTKKGKPVVTCGTFNVSGRGATTIRMIAAYELKEFDGWAITKYDAESHTDRVVMTET